jgi:hypothetical protein
MKCNICGDHFGIFSSTKKCSMGHEYHKGCLSGSLKNFTIYTMLSECKSCIIELLPELKSTDFCIDCKSYVNKNEIHCNHFKHLCRNCDLKYINRSLMEKCEGCANKHPQSEFVMCNGCDLVYKKSDVIDLLSCKTHVYCRSCLNSTQMNNPNCSLCEKFISGISNSRRGLCSNSTNPVTSSDLSCELGHIYCETCVKFSKFFYECCRACKKLHNNVHQELEVKLKSKSTDSVRPDLKSPILDLKNTESPLNSFNDPRVNQKLQTTSETKRIPKALDREISPQALSIRNYNDYPIAKSPEIQNTITEKLNKEPCIKSFNLRDYKALNNPSMEHDEVIKNSIQSKRSFINLDSLFKCDKNCENPSILTFECYHNTCLNCYSTKYWKRVEKLYSRICNKDYKKIKAKFEIKCGLDRCQSIIRVPYRMMKKYIPGHWTQELIAYLDSISMYMDGLKVEFYDCKCNTIVLKINSTRINCRCSYL